MSSTASQQSIRSIMRRSSLNEGDTLNILTFCTHERYEQGLCKTGHNFYSMNHGKTWNTDYGLIPANYQQIDIAPWHVNFDLILCHTSCERIMAAKQMQQLFNIPIMRHTHVLPDIRFDVQSQVANFNAIEVDHDCFISRYNMEEWGKNLSKTTSFIEHGIDTNFWSGGDSHDRENVCISVVNDWPNRDWCCGWNLWQQTVGFNSPDQLPIKVFGSSPGLSEPASSLEALREGYKKSSIFLNTSIHSPVPTVLMEAMACGCAIVSTNNCMIPEIVNHGENGLLANTPEELREHCEYLLNDPDEARRLGDNAKATIINEFNLDRFVEGWNKQFFNVIKNYRK